ncbi:MAG: hypothetical protein OIF57_13750 [Marinobacterium sp.]|nr:hypothetical protein [Marinobacterium sp.]
MKMSNTSAVSANNTFTVRVLTRTAVAALVTTLMCAGATVQAGDIEIRKFSPSVDISKVNKNSFNKRYTLNNRRTDTRINNSRRSDLRYSYDLNQKYNLDQLKAQQTYNQKRHYSSSISQNANNTAGDQGHNMNQYQGDTRVSTSSADRRNHVHSGLSLLSPGSRSSSASTHGMSYKGNFEMYGSQIGAGQSGFQGGDNTNLQSNSQYQYGNAHTGSRDSLRNGNRN